MNRKLILAGLLVAVAMLVVAAPLGAAPPTQRVDPIAVDISHRLRNQDAPEQLSPAAGATVATLGATTESQCFGNDDTMTITIPSFDPANPGSQNVVFFKETPDGATGKATLWVAWDFLDTQWGRQDVITCDQLDYLQGSMDSIVDTDTYYFGAYDDRPAGNDNLDVMIYNIVDEGYFDPDFPFYIAGFFWGSLNEAFDRNMIFIDSYDWANRLGPDATRAYLYEGTVAHELQHLIHHDHDIDEPSWIDEGMADLAEFLNGFGHPDGHVVYYMAFHRTSLTNWGGGLEDYGASYLFQLYLLENYGNKVGGVYDNSWTTTLIDEQANSIAGVEAATGDNFEDIFDSWIMANLVDDPGLSGPGGFPLGYNEIDLAPYNSPVYGSWSIERAITDIYGSNNHGNLPVDRYYGGYVSGTVEYPVDALAPYAAHYSSYKGIQPGMDIFLRGEAGSGVAPYGGSYEMASGGGNLLTDRMLALNAPVGGTLNFQTWYDIETEWDYGFVEASTDGGANWAPLAGNITTTSNNPNASTAWANSLVSGQASTNTAITGNSGGWVGASFTLPAAANVLVRFSYYTDEAVNGQGWFIDDVSVDGFSDGFEGGAGAWTTGGWQWTTGLFDNDWVVAYSNPVYDSGKFSHLDYGFVDDDVMSGAYEYELGSADTNNIGQDAAIVVFANRPGESPFAGAYLLLVDKQNNGQ